MNNTAHARNTCTYMHNKYASCHDSLSQTIIIRWSYLGACNCLGTIILSPNKRSPLLTVNFSRCCQYDFTSGISWCLSGQPDEHIFTVTPWPWETIYFNHSSLPGKLEHTTTTNLSTSSWKYTADMWGVDVGALVMYQLYTSASQEHGEWKFKSHQPKSKPKYSGW